MTRTLPHRERNGQPRYQLWSITEWIKKWPCGPKLRTRPHLPVAFRSSCTGDRSMRPSSSPLPASECSGLARPHMTSERSAEGVGVRVVRSGDRRPSSAASMTGTVHRHGGCTAICWHVPGRRDRHAGADRSARRGRSRIGAGRAIAGSDHPQCHPARRYGQGVRVRLRRLQSRRARRASFLRLPARSRRPAHRVRVRRRLRRRCRAGGAGNRPRRQDEVAPVAG